MKQAFTFTLEFVEWRSEQQPVSHVRRPSAASNAYLKLIDKQHTLPLQVIWDLCKSRHWLRLQGLSGNRILSVILLLPGSLKPALTHWESQRRSQLQYRGLAPRALNTHTIEGSDTKLSLLTLTVNTNKHTELCLQVGQRCQVVESSFWDSWKVITMESPGGEKETEGKTRVYMNIKRIIDLVTNSRGRHLTRCSL